MLNDARRFYYQIAGSRRAYYEASKERRKEIRETAHRMQQLGASYATAQAAEATEKRGFIYIITNPAWPAHVKIGRAFDPESRLNGYQTGSPERDYSLRYAVFFDDCHEAERLIHDTLADYRAQGEWFRILPSTAEHVLNMIGGYL